MGVLAPDGGPLEPVRQLRWPGDDHPDRDGHVDVLETLLEAYPLGYTAVDEGVDADLGGRITLDDPLMTEMVEQVVLSVLGIHDDWSFRSYPPGRTGPR